MENFIKRIQSLQVTNQIIFNTWKKKWRNNKKKIVGKSAESCSWALGHGQGGEGDFTSNG